MERYWLAASQCVSRGFGGIPRHLSLQRRDCVFDSSSIIIGRDPCKGFPLRMFLAMPEDAWGSDRVVVFLRESLGFYGIFWIVFSRFFFSGSLFVSGSGQMRLVSDVLWFAGKSLPSHLISRNSRNSISCSPSGLFLVRFFENFVQKWAEVQLKCQSSSNELYRYYKAIETVMLFVTSDGWSCS